MSVAPTPQQPIKAKPDGVPQGTVSNDTGMRSGELFSQVDPGDNAVRRTQINQRWQTIAEAAQNVIRIHALRDDDLAWAAAAFHPM